MKTIKNANLSTLIERNVEDAIIYDRFERDFKIRLYKTFGISEENEIRSSNVRICILSIIFYKYYYKTNNESALICKRLYKYQDNLEKNSTATISTNEFIQFMQYFLTPEYWYDFDYKNHIITYNLQNDLDLLKEYQLDENNENIVEDLVECIRNKIMSQNAMIKLTTEYLLYIIDNVTAYGASLRDSYKPDIYQIIQGLFNPRLMPPFTKYTAIIHQFDGKELDELESEIIDTLY